MGQQLSSREQALYRAADEVLQYIWDPIGIAGIPQARDEYHGYLPQILALLQNGADETEIAGFLGEITTERMGLALNPPHDLAVAKILLEWKAVV